MLLSCHYKYGIYRILILVNRCVKYITLMTSFKLLQDPNELICTHFTDREESQAYRG